MFLLSAQNECKVLKKGIDESYEGECKKGLAHGEGIAKGEDYYKGEFKKGLPHGDGIYKWKEGQIYEGSWKNGERNGSGKYYFQADGKDKTLVGIWKNDEYKGLPTSMKYSVIRKVSIERYAIRRVEDGNQVEIKFVQMGTTNSTISDFFMTGSSGFQVEKYNSHVFEGITFPFKGRIKYSTMNQTKTQQLKCVFEYEIKQPGKWVITLHN